MNRFKLSMPELFNSARKGVDPLTDQQRACDDATLACQSPDECAPDIRFPVSRRNPCSGGTAVLASSGQAKRLRRSWIAGLAAAASACATGTAFAGGYVAPIFNVPPTAPVITGVAPQSWWLALLPLLFLAFAGRGGGGSNGLTPLPPDHGGPCFGEGTLIQLERGWVAVEAIVTGDRIVTSRGIQTVLSVESWQPVDYRDRPVVVEGVRLSPNHGISSSGVIMPACNMSGTRARIDGCSYFHVLVRDHSWLLAKADTVATVIQAESLCLTADLRLAKTFPDLVAHHAAEPVAAVRMDMKGQPARAVA